jgi:two-component system, LytTR family, response regulator
MTVRVLVVDDERLARRELRRLLATQEGVEVIGEAESVRGAAEVARAAEADLVLLDIQLGSESGFDLIPLLDPGVRVIFTTAFDQYAIRAFEAEALDYLLKPVSPERLARALRRIHADETPRPTRPLTRDDVIIVRTGSQPRTVSVRDIAAVTAQGQRSEVALVGGEMVTVRRSLTEWEQRLPQASFVRVHRSTLVNLEAVVRMDEWSHGAYRIHVRGGSTPIVTSRRCAVRLRARFA